MTLPVEYQDPTGSAIARSTSAVWAAHSDVIAAYLFGSVARGCASPGSDVDLAVVVRGGAHLDRARLVSALTGALTTDELDLVVLNDAGLTLVHRVLRDGRLLFSRDDKARIEFTRRRLLEYFDTESLRRAARRSIVQWTRAERSR